MGGDVVVGKQLYQVTAIGLLLLQQESVWTEGNQFQLNNIAAVMTVRYNRH